MINGCNTFMVLQLAISWQSGDPYRQYIMGRSICVQEDKEEAGKRNPEQYWMTRESNSGLRAKSRRLPGIQSS